MAWLSLLPMALLAAWPARAQDPASTDGETAPAAGAASDLVGVSDVTYKRRHPMELNLRARWLSIPDSILDIWYFNENDPGANPLPRPKAHGYVVGLEYVLKPRPTNWIFYVEYGGNLMPEGYFDDIEEPAQHDDGDYIRPDAFGLLVAGANYGHEIEAAPWVSFVLGGGLGLAVVTGELTQWNGGGDTENTEPDCLSNAPAYERVDVCQDDGPKRLPGVLPMIDISAAVRFNLGDSANIRIDGGIHDMIYVGTAMGVVF